jgi:hypothetical protein
VQADNRASSSLRSELSEPALKRKFRMPKEQRPLILAILINVAARSSKRSLMQQVD